jgi:hypothetical protein
MARSTKRVCRDCGFFLPLSGSLGAMFGVCGNELSADGQVVDKQYGCGAHSDTPAPAGTGSPMYEPFDDGVLDVVQPPPEPPQPSETSEAQLEPSESPAEPPESATGEARPELSAEPRPEEPEPEQEGPEAAPQAEAPQPEESQAEAPQPEESQPEESRAD